MATIRPPKLGNNVNDMHRAGPALLLATVWDDRGGAASSHPVDQSGRVFVDGMSRPNVRRVGFANAFTMVAYAGHRLFTAALPSIFVQRTAGFGTDGIRLLEIVLRGPGCDVAML